jgi:hypothetical protein
MGGPLLYALKTPYQIEAELHVGVVGAGHPHQAMRQNRHGAQHQHGRQLVELGGA